MGEHAAGEEPGQAVLEQLFTLRSDLIRCRSRALRQAGAAWFDLAVGYARDVRKDSLTHPRGGGAQRTLAELDESLRRCTVEEIRFGQMIEQVDRHIADVARGALPARRRAARAAAGPGLLGVALRAMRERVAQLAAGAPEQTPDVG